MNFQTKGLLGKTSILTLLLTLLFAVGMSQTALAVEPTICTQGQFTWRCADGSETYAVEPEPPISGQAGNGYFTSVFFSDAGLGGNGYVQFGPGMTMRFKTAQKYGAWWDASDTLHVVEAINGTITIPTGAVMVSIPGDILGNFALTGWVKGQRLDTGEYVLGSTRWARR